MAQLTYKIDLTSASFPLLSEKLPRTVVVPKQEKEALYDTPQIYYAHNVMPTQLGYQAVSYQDKTAPVVSPGSVFSSLHLLRDISENKAYFSHTSDGKNWVLLSPFYTWVETTYIPAASVPTAIVTTAHINGETYIYFAGVGCYKYIFASNTLSLVTLTTLVPSAILGIIASSGYLLAWSSTALAWSSTTNPTDFTPSAISGAGAASIQEAAGKLVTFAKLNNGLVVFTTANAIGVSYTGNGSFPFSFSEIKGSGGIASQEMVTYTGNAVNIFAYTTNGLQKISLAQAETILPEITDFLAGGVFEDFDEGNLTFSKVRLAADAVMVKRLHIVSNRYLIISYGVTSLTHAIVVDLSRQRIGKLKLAHVQCFEFNVLDPEVIETPLLSLAFVQANGQVYIADFTSVSDTAVGILILGKYQYVREEYLQLHEISIEDIPLNAVLTVYTSSNLDGKSASFFQVTRMSSPANSLVRKYGFRRTALNHSILLKGSFDLVSGHIVFTLAGSR